MTMSHKKSRSGQYYIDCMTVEQLNKGGKGIDDYYSGTAKEPPGEWYTAKSGQLGLQNGAVFKDGDKDAFKNLCNGFDPRTGEKLTQNSGNEKRIALHDFAFSAPKSVSVLWGQVQGEDKRQIEDAQRSSVRDALDFFSDKGAYSRQGKGGEEKVKTDFIGATFEHGSSRDNDCQLHTHATIFNLCIRPDGSTGAIETRDAMRWQGAVASMYHAGLAYKLREMGCRIEKDKKLFVIDGVPKDVCDAFSSRRKAIVKAVEDDQRKRGMTPDASRASREHLQKAAIETRLNKNELSREELQTLWIKKGKELGFTEVEAREVMNLGEPLEQLSDEELKEEALLAIEKLTETDAVFREPAMYTAIAVHLTGRASVQDIKRAVDFVRPELVMALETVDGERREKDKVYSTREMLSIERDLKYRAGVRMDDHVIDFDKVQGHIDAKHDAMRAAAIADIVSKGGDPRDVESVRGLEAEQQNALVKVCGDKRQVSVIEGTAGAGKTFTARTLADIYKENGYQVHGLASGWSQALNLRDEAKLDSGRAITGWLKDVNSGKIELGKKDVIILDEAGLVGAKDMRDVIRAAQDAGAKVVLLGDTLQQSSVSAGDAMRTVVKEAGSVRLDVIRRQKDDGDKAAVHEFFSGDAKTALERYVEKGNVHIAETDEETNDLIIKDWMQSRVDHKDKSHVMLAYANIDVDNLNMQAHDARKEAGELGEKSLHLETMDCKDKDDRREFNEGDAVVFRVTTALKKDDQDDEQPEKIFNRVRGTIERIDDKTGILHIRTDENKLVKLDPTDKKWIHKDSGKLALQHDYATSIYASQGISRDYVFLKDHPGLCRKQVGVGFSRHKEDCNLYINREARYDAKIKLADSEDWHPKDEFKDDEVLARTKRSYGKESDKDSTLDYQDWKDASDDLIKSGADVWRERCDEVADAWEQSRKTVDERAKEELPYQSDDAYVLSDLPELSAKEISDARQQLSHDGVEGAIIVEAERQGFVSYDNQGNTHYNGMRTDGKTVNRIKDGRREDGPMRDEFPPILRGDDREISVVGSGADALSLWSQRDKERRVRPTVIVAAGNARDALSQKRVREILAKSEKNPDLPYSNTRKTDSEEFADAKANIAIASGKNALVSKEHGSVVSPAAYQRAQAEIQREAAAQAQREREQQQQYQKNT